MTKVDQLRADFVVIFHCDFGRWVMADFEPDLSIRNQVDKRILRSALEDAFAFQVTDLLKIAENSIL